jgi:hypothetical protein
MKLADQHAMSDKTLRYRCLINHRVLHAVDSTTHAQAAELACVWYLERYPGPNPSVLVAVSPVDAHEHVKVFDVHVEMVRHLFSVERKQG